MTDDVYTSLIGVPLDENPPPDEGDLETPDARLDQFDGEAEPRGLLSDPDG